MKIKKIQSLLCLLFCIVIVLQLASCAGEKVTGILTGNTAVERFEDGTKEYDGAIKVVDLHGSWREMGRQYGSLMKAELNDIYEFVSRISGASDENEQKTEKIVTQQTGQTEYTIREYFAGAAETSGLTAEQLQAVNAVERIAGLPMCSAVIAWDEYAKDDLVVGRNYDYGEIFKQLADDVVVTVYHPADGSLATATVGYVGEIYAVNALNEKGIFMELNNGKASAALKSPNYRITGTSLLFDMMFEADSLEYADLFFNTSNCSSSYIINMASADAVRSYEWCPVAVKRGDAAEEDGLLVSTNHYVNGEWDFPLPSDDASWKSVTRYNNLTNLCEKNKGGIDAEIMKGIMDTGIDDGGARGELTVYQMVVEPVTLSMWLKVIGASEWTEIDMSHFLLDD